MRKTDIFKAWGRILTGYRPALSIEITKACPLSCPGCYAFQPEHVNGGSIENLADYHGDDLVERVLELVEREKPLGIYIVGGEPLVRYRELNRLLPKLSGQGIEVHVVTSAVRRIPEGWAQIDNLVIEVSIDGLAPEHDVRRAPATYDRILESIRGHRIRVHSTVTSQMMSRHGYLEEFVRFWSGRPEVTGIQVSLFTPQVGEQAVEILTPEQRRMAVDELDRLRHDYPKLRMNQYLRGAFLSPPESPDACGFARVTQTLSADLKTRVEPCQFGGTPDCSQCGCLATMGLKAVLDYRLPVGIKVGTLFEASMAVGDVARRLRGGERGLPKVGGPAVSGTTE